MFELRCLNGMQQGVPIYVMAHGIPYLLLARKGIMLVFIVMSFNSKRVSYRR